jgi:glucose/arabinose dehydrogenase
MPAPTWRQGIILMALPLLSAASVSANLPPDRPTITEPAIDASSIDPADVHMATAPFADPDAGDSHLCSDWEIRARDSVAGTVVWQAGCVEGTLKVHIHLGDGQFSTSDGPLLGLTAYRVRVRFRDSSGDPASEWSDWAERDFNTAVSSSTQPMELVDILSLPLPLLEAEDGPLQLAPQASVAVQSVQDALLLRIQGNGAVENPPPLGSHGAIKVVVESGGREVSIPASTLTFSDEGNTRRTIYLPPLTLPADGQAVFWIARDGSSFHGSGSDHPDFTSLARNAPIPWKLTEDGYQVERVVSGLQLPVNLAFAPRPSSSVDAPLFYITELYGTVKAVLRDGTVREYASGLLNYDPNGIFPGSGEQGTTGTVVDPATGDLFVAGIVADVSGIHHPRVLRLRSSDGGRTASGKTTIFDAPGEEVGPSHQISNLTIGPDGALYVHIGDGFFTERARDLGSFRGKILRMNLDGTPRSDNPFYDLSDGITATDYIFALGFRNPFGGAWRQSDGAHYEVENGPAVDRLARVDRGRDYGWDGSDASMYVGASFNWPQPVAPVALAFIQPETFDGSGFPPEKFDHAFVSESGPTWASGIPARGKKILELAFGENGEVIAASPLLIYVGIGKATVAALAAGPDGLYFTDLYPDRIDQPPTVHAANVYRIRFVGSAVIHSHLRDLATRAVSFDATISMPRYNSLRWDFGDGTSSTEARPSHVYPIPGRYDIRLSVSGEKETIEAYSGVDFSTQEGQGLWASYTDLKSGTKFVTVDPRIDFDWKDGSPDPAIGADAFSGIWSGEIVPELSGTYSFSMESKGTPELWVDHRLLVGSADAGTPQREIRLEAGMHYAVSLAYLASQGQRSLHLLWSHEGDPAEIVPTRVLYPVPLRRPRLVAPN